MPLIIYSENTSGKKSRKWNKFDNWALLLAGENHQQPFKYFQAANNPGLPKEANRDLNNIHMITCSNKVPCMKLVEGFIHDLTQLETEGMVMYNSHLKTDVLVKAPVIMAICDNPRASEMLSHMGGTVNKYWRMCMVSKSVRSMLHNYSALTSQCDKTVNPTSIAKERTKTSSMTQISLIKQAEDSPYKPNTGYMTYVTHFSSYQWISLRIGT